MAKLRMQIERFGPRTWDLTFACLAALLPSLGIGALIYFVLWQATPHAVHASARPVGVIDVLKATLGIAAFVGAVFASVYAYRRQRVAEEGHLAERYQSAVDQLGHERPAARLAGIYAMARLADDWNDQRQNCIDVLCAYLRLPYEADKNAQDYERGEHEVRRTTLKLIRNHLRDRPQGKSWQGRNFSFEGAVFDCGDLSDAVFKNGHVSFHGARFVGGTFFLSGVRFETGAHVYFKDAVFAGGSVTFEAASFVGGSVTFEAATFAAGEVDFTGVTGATAEIPDFTGVTGATAGIPDFTGAQFNGTIVAWGGVPQPAGWSPSSP